MCWLLIRAFSDTDKTSWQLGDIVEVRPDNFSGWGTQETLPKFFRVQITGVSAETVKGMLELAETHQEIQPDQTFKTVYDRVRNWSIKPADVPAAIRNELQSTGTLTITKNQALNFIKNNLGEAVSLP